MCSAGYGLAEGIEFDRGELCGLGLRDVDRDQDLVTISAGISQLSGQPLIIGSTKNRRRRLLTVGPPMVDLVLAQETLMADRARFFDETSRLMGSCFQFPPRTLNHGDGILRSSILVGFGAGWGTTQHQVQTLR